MRLVILSYFSLVALLEVLLGSVTGTASDSAFALGGQHVLMLIGLTLLLLGIVSLSITRFGGFLIAPILRIEAGLFFLFLLSSFYSASFFVSFGQSIISFFGLIISMIIGRHCFFKKELGCDYFFDLWLQILLSIYLVKFFGGVYFQGEARLVPSDEKALLAAVCGFYFITRLATLRSIISVFLLFLGASFSAFVASVPLLLSIRLRFFGVILILSSFIAGYYLFLLVESGSLLIYGKSAEYFISGSGRFAVYKELMEVIARSHPLHWFIGNGFMSERTALVNKGLPWTVDAHNNLLQSLYGVGVVGTAVMLYLWYKLAKFFATEVNTVFHQSSKFFLCAVISCAAFGLTSSHFFSRPSMTAIFITSLYYFCWLYVYDTKKHGLRGAFDD